MGEPNIVPFDEFIRAAQRDTIAELRVQLSAAIGERDRLRVAVETVKAHVVGDRFSNWGDADRVTASRAHIADTCDAALSTQSSEKS